MQIYDCGLQIELLFAVLMNRGLTVEVSDTRMVNSITNAGNYKL